MKSLSILALLVSSVAMTACAPSSSPAYSPNVQPVLSDILNNPKDRHDFSLRQNQYAIVNYVMNQGPYGQTDGPLFFQYYYGPGQTVLYERTINSMGKALTYTRSGGVVFENR